MSEPEYLSYLLRLWKVKTASGTHWRASLENPITNERQGFSDLEALFTFLEWIVEDPPFATSNSVEEDKE